MLKTLNSVRWNKLEHAYGKANDVPQLIRDLTSSSATVREQALSALYGNLWHQGTVFKATAYAVPFLIELLEQPTVEDKQAILIYLSDLAQGSSYADVHQDSLLLQTQRDTAKFQEQMRRELDWLCG
ncbi:hypothetical protein ACKFKG_05990 [Phormidesmis sp. 146-35]